MKRLSLFLCFIFLSLQANAGLDLSKKRYIVHLKKTDRLMTKSVDEVTVTREIYEVPEDAKETFFEIMESREDVSGIEENILMRYHEMDPLFSYQWSLLDSSGGMDIENSWMDFSEGKNNIVVAVIDSGVLLDHPDLEGALLPGADFVSDSFVANDGDGRDMDPSDPGNWNNAGECGIGSRAKNSNWHGTHVAGIVGARKNNFGVTGVAPGVSLLPIRAMGKCGGYLSDVADAIIWAAGGNISGMPKNNNPAKVINLSLGGYGDCGSTMQNAINFARAQGAVVVVAVGNDTVNMDLTAIVPVSCQGVVNVASNDSDGGFSSFSNYGVEVDVTAPGGYNNGTTILNLGNNGLTSPGDNQFLYKAGTSMSAPHVAGLAALIFSVNENLYPDQVEQLLKDNARGISSPGSGYGVIQSYDTLAMAVNETPDASFKTDEPVVSRQPSSSLSFGDSNQEEVAACGSVNLNGSGGPGGGGFLPSLIFGAFMMMAFSRIRKTRLQTM
jgi:serine protease